MAISIVSLGKVGDTAARSTYTCTISRAPAQSTLILVSVLVSDTAGTPAEPSSVSGAGLVFSLITSSITFDPTGASQLHNFSVWKGMGTSSIVSSFISARFSGNQTGCAMLVHEVSGVSTSGTSGANAIGKSANSVADGGSFLTIFAPSATSTANAWFTASGVDDTADTDRPQNTYTYLDSVTYGTPVTELGSGWTTISSSNSVQWSGVGTGNRAGVMIELVLDNPAAPGGDVGPGNYYQYYSHVIVGEAA